MGTLLHVTMVLALTMIACDGGEPLETPPRSDGSRSPQATAGPGDPPTPTDQALARCENPDGFSIAYPAEWYTNPGQIVPPCSQFSPESFEVPRGTDERVAPITAYIDPVPFERARDGVRGSRVERTDMTIDGLPAVRFEYATGPDGIWPAGTAITIYMIDLPRSGEERDRTLFVDTVGLEIFDYQHNQEILDRMAPRVELTG